MYSISSYGRVKSIKRNLIMKQHLNTHGYYIIRINKQTKTIHRLVAQTFIPNPENKKTVNHIDGNKLNNKVYNLEWATHSENLKHAFEIGLCCNKGENHSRNKLTECQVNFIRRSTLKQVELAKMYNVTEMTISNIKLGKSWTHI